MKILLVGSKSIHVSSYINALNSQGVIPSLITEEILVYKEVSEEYVIPFRSSNPIKLFSAYRQLHTTIKKIDPDIVHVHQINRLAYFVTRICSKLKINCISTAWGSDVLLIPQKNRLFAYLVKKSLIRSQLVTADSQAMIEVMQTLVSSKEKYKHIQYGIELVDPLVKEKIIYSNRLHNPLYRIDQIIEYFSEIVIDYPQWQLVIAGEGSETKTLKKLAESKGIVDKVNFVGWQTLEENNRWYGKSSIYISIPESDGTAVSLLEAMSAGCIPIVPNLEVSKEWITDLKTGIIETSGKNPLLSAMILDINECGKENRMMVEQKAVKSVCTKKFIEFYKSLSNEA